MNKIDPGVKRFFPWALFLVLAALLAFAASRVHAEEDVWACYGSQRYQAMSSNWVQCNEMGRKGELCSRVEQYLLSHTVEEGRAEAAKNNVPAWLRAKAERCIRK